MPSYYISANHHHLDAGRVVSVEPPHAAAAGAARPRGPHGARARGPLPLPGSAPAPRAGRGGAAAPGTARPHTRGARCWSRHCVSLWRLLSGCCMSGRCAREDECECGLCGAELCSECCVMSSCHSRHSKRHTPLTCNRRSYWPDKPVLELRQPIQEILTNIEPVSILFGLDIILYLHCILQSMCVCSVQLTFH